MVQNYPSVREALDMIPNTTKTQTKPSKDNRISQAVNNSSLLLIFCNRLVNIY
jgi:hypothetical protein